MATTIRSMRMNLARLRTATNKQIAKNVRQPNFEKQAARVTKVDMNVRLLKD